MDDANYPLPNLDGTVSEIASILAKGWSRLSAGRRAGMVEPAAQGDVTAAGNSDQSSEKGLDSLGPRSLPARALTPGERRRNGG